MFVKAYVLPTKLPHAGFLSSVCSVKFELRSQCILLAAPNIIEIKCADTVTWRAAQSSS